MAQFLVKIADDRGRLAQHVESGYSESEVRERFVQQGYLVYWVKPQGLFAGGKFQLGGRKVKQGPFVIFNQQFLTLIKAGLPILNALDLLIKRQKDGNMKSLLQNVRERVKSGELLSDSFAAQGVFPRIYTTTLMAGEKSGNIEEVLGRYIAFQRLALTFKKKLAVSLVYPALLVTMVMVMIVFLVTYVVPEFAKLFENLNAKLPAITVLMLEVGTRAQKLAPFLAIGAVVIVAFFWRWKNTDRGAEQIDSVILKMPLLGDIWLKYQVANFSRMLSTLLAGGLPRHRRRVLTPGAVEHPDDRRTAVGGEVVHRAAGVPLLAHHAVGHREPPAVHGLDGSAALPRDHAEVTHRHTDHRRDGRIGDQLPSARQDVVDHDVG